jgi:hypothetical protein
MPPTDLSKFKRDRQASPGATLGHRSSVCGLNWIASRVEQEVDARIDPLLAPLSVLRRMDRDPVVYLAEWAITALPRKPDLYHVSHPGGDKKLEAEVEEWLWPLLPKLLPMICRAFVYGVDAYAFDWVNEDLIFFVDGKGKKPRKRTLKDHWHYSDSHEVFPDRVEALYDNNDKYLGMIDHETGKRYDAGRSQVSIWDQQYGEIQGQAARRRALAAVLKSEIFDLLKSRYLERTVHVPTIVYASEEDIERSQGDTDEISLGDFIAEQMAELYGGGFMSLPSNRDENGNLKIEAVPHELPERSDVFDRALNRFDAQKLAAYLVPPATVMLEEGLGGGASRVLKELFSTFVEALATFVANELTKVVERVHATNHPADSVPPEVKTNEIPEKAQKRYLQVLAAIGDAAELGRRVDVDGLLDQLGVPRGGDAPGQQPGQQQPGTPGPDRDPQSDRQRRRDDAVTDQGEEDTGAEEVDGEERPGGDQ